MWRIVFAGVIAMPLVAAGQTRDIPGRDLLSFPLGLTAEPAAMGSQSGSGFWNPATGLVPDGGRWHFSINAMNTGDDLGLSAQLGSAAIAWGGTTFGVSVARASVVDLQRTEADPQNIGNDIPYTTTLFSAFAARRVASHFVVGLSVRSRTGQVDNATRTGTSFDAGVIADHLTPLDIRLGASTFLLSVFGNEREHESLLLGGDIRVFGADSTRTIRSGYSLMDTPGLSTEHYAFVSGRWGRWEVRGGPLRTEIYGSSNLRLRLGIAVRNAGWIVGFSREETANGLSPTYHFSLAATVP